MKNKAVLQLTFFSLFCGVVLLGCTSIRVAGDVQKGRMQLMHGDPKVALIHFQSAAQLQPDYLLNFTLLNQGIWTYVGRAYYATERLPEARQALEKARSRYDEDHLARIYLGLVLRRDGDSNQGLKELEAGLRGLNGWFEYVHHNVREGHFWDPGRAIRGEIDRGLQLIASGNADWEGLTKSAEWIGHKTEMEIDLVARDMYRDETESDDDGCADC
ncbi:MAG: hypothetical protein WD688_25405 [Candidatus Binatia bacterium]